MKTFEALSLLSLFLCPVLSQDLIERLNALGCTAFAADLVTNDQALVTEIGRRMDVTVWAPSNEAVQRRLTSHGTLAKRASSGNDGQASHNAPDPTNPEYDNPFEDLRKKKRQVGQNPAAYRDTIFETIYTFIRDPQFVNLGNGSQVARFVKNYASPVEPEVDTLSFVEVTSGLGDVQNTLRGPFPFSNGVIYEVSDYFTFPAPFTETMETLNISQSFYDLVVKSGNLPLFEEAPAITIFVPLDSSCDPRYWYGNSTGLQIDPESYVLWADGGLAQYFSNALLPGRTLTTKSGDPIKITWADNGEILVNGRRLVKPNVSTKNGVIHFIDGSLHGSCNGTITGPGPTPPPTQDENGATSTTSGIAGAFVAAFGAALMSLF